RRTSLSAPSEAYDFLKDASIPGSKGRKIYPFRLKKPRFVPETIRQPRSEGADSGAGRPQNHAPGKFFRPGDGPFGGNELFLQPL
uniref:hypothetical protein n=1 Tax=Alistipes shahii TaxID=328814 RepID=UPI003FF13792